MMQTEMTRNPYCQTIPGSIAHPLAHRLRLTASRPCSQKYSVPEHSLNISSFPLNSRTAFEVERPQSQGSPRLIININTTFKKGYLEYTSRKKRVPTFPDIRRESGVVPRRRKGSRATDYELKSLGYRHPSAASSSHGRAVPGSTRRLSGSLLSAQERERRDLSSLEKLSSSQASQLVQINGSAIKTKDISDPIQQRPTSPSRLTSEKRLWISDWISDTSVAMKLDQMLTRDEVPVSTLSVIEEI